MKVKSSFLHQFCVIDKCKAKLFIKLMLNPDPTQRPTAHEAYHNHVGYCLTRSDREFTHDV